jgi:cell division protein FtsZ
VLARVSRTLGATVIGVAMLPCAIEGAEPAQIARDGLTAFEAHCDALVAVPSDRLLALTPATASLHQIHRAVDGVLLRCIEDVCTLVTTPGVINLDVADIRTIFDGGGKTLLAMGAATGDDRARAAAERAITSQWLDATLDGARDIVFNVTAGPGLSLFEINEVADIIRAAAHPDSRVLFGAQVDDRAGASLRITLLATGM